MQALYIEGPAGVHSCPDGYKVITNPDKCEAVSKILDLVYRPSRNTNKDDSVCNWCGGCENISTRVDHRYRSRGNSYGTKIRFICELK